jgi:hypothetical protein
MEKVLSEDGENSWHRKGKDWVRRGKRSGQRRVKVGSEGGKRSWQRRMKLMESIEVEMVCCRVGGEEKVSLAARGKYLFIFPQWGYFREW